MGINFIQLCWITQQDWYVSQEKIGFDEYAVTVTVYESNGNLGTKVFTDFQKLKSWGGY